MNARDIIENLWDRAASVGPLLDAYRAAILREAADAIESKQAECETAERDQFGSLDHETHIQGERVRDMATMLRRMAEGPR